MIEAILQHAASLVNNGPYITMTYGQGNPNDNTWSFQVDPNALENLTQARGIYFLLSHNNTRLQKIGMTNGACGLRQRVRGYLRGFNPNLPNADKTAAFWYRIMTGIGLNDDETHIIDGAGISVYFASFEVDQNPNHPLTNTLDIHEAIFNPHADLERQFIQQVRDLRYQFNEQHPGINGFPNDYALPLLLDSANRIRRNRFAGNP